MPKSLKIWLAILILAGVIALGFMSARRAVKGSNDFDTFYYAGQAVLEGKGIYYIGDYYQGDKARAPFLYPPFAAIAFAPLALMPIKAAAFIWNFLCVGFFAMAFALCGRMLGQSSNSVILSPPKAGEESQTRSFAPLRMTQNILNPFRWEKEPSSVVALLFLFALLIDNLTMAQVNLAVLLLTLGSLWLITKGQAFRGGILMTAAIAVKATPLIFIPYFLLKRKWKALAGCVAGAIFFFLLLPTLVFGWNQNALFHRQWLGKSLKPALIGIYSKIYPENPHPFKKSVKVWQTADLYNLLTPKNQSLSAVAARLFLKDRNAYANDTEPRILVAKRYEKLPVLFGGLPYEALKTAISLTQTVLVIFMFGLFCRRKGAPVELQALELSLLFLSMTLFSPLARSHQFIFWMLPVLLMAGAWKIQSLERYAKALHVILYVGIGLYVLQALPYGKAAGMGMWANLVLWMGLMGTLTQLPSAHKTGA